MATFTANSPKRTATTCALNHTDPSDARYRCGVPNAKRSVSHPRLKMACTSATFNVPATTPKKISLTLVPKTATNGISKIAGMGDPAT
jgi:hypothetical protein